MGTKRSYTKEFKIQACEMVLNDGIKHKIVAEHLGISHIMLYRWIDQYQTYGENAFVGKGNLHTADAELRRLRKENERLQQENEILKKAAAYFAKHPAEK